MRLYVRSGSSRVKSPWITLSPVPSQRAARPRRRRGRSRRRRRRRPYPSGRSGGVPNRTSPSRSPDRETPPGPIGLASGRRHIARCRGQGRRGRELPQAIPFIEGLQAVETLLLDPTPRLDLDHGPSPRCFRSDIQCSPAQSSLPQNLTTRRFGAKKRDHKAMRKSNAGRGIAAEESPRPDP